MSIFKIEERLGYLSYLLKQAQEFVDVVGPIVQLVVGLLSLPEGDDALGAVDLRPDRTGGDHLGDIFLGLGFRQIQQLRQSCTLYTLIVLRHHSNVLKGCGVSKEGERERRVATYVFNHSRVQVLPEVFAKTMLEDFQAIQFSCIGRLEGRPSDQRPCDE